MRQYSLYKLIAVIDLLIGAFLFSSEFGINVGLGVFFVGAGFYLIITRTDT